MAKKNDFIIGIDLAKGKDRTVIRKIKLEDLK